MPRSRTSGARSTRPRCWARSTEARSSRSGGRSAGSFLDYELPTADQIPLIDVELIEVPSPVGPLGAKGVGEPPAIPAPAAVANALARATGIRLREVPVDRSKLIR